MPSEYRWTGCCRIRDAEVPIGVMLNTSGICDDKIEQRIITAASNVIGAMRKQMLDRRELKKSTKVRIYL